MLALGLALVNCGEEGNEPAAAPSSTTTAAPTTTTTAAGLSEASPLRLDGIGPIKVGMSLAQATAAVGKPVEVNPDYVLDNCAYARVQGGPEGLSFMVLRDNAADPWRIVRVNVNDNPRLATLAGVRIGATEADVKSTYSGPGETGTIAVTGHEYVEGGHYITYDVDGPQGLLLLFETDGTKVTEFRSGQQDPVGYPEGCA